MIIMMLIRAYQICRVPLSARHWGALSLDLNCFLLSTDLWSAGVSPATKVNIQKWPAVILNARWLSLVFHFKGSLSFSKLHWWASSYGMMESVVLHFSSTLRPSAVMLSWLEETTAVTQALLSQNSCSLLGFQRCWSPQKGIKRGWYKGEKVTTNLRFSYFPVLSITSFNFWKCKMYCGISDSICAAKCSSEFKLLGKLCLCCLC